MIIPTGIKARRAWLDLPAATRAQAKQLASAGQPHPNRDVRIAAVGWQRYQYQRAGRLSVWILVLSPVATVLLLAAAFEPPGLIFAVPGVLLTFVVLGFELVAALLQLRGQSLGALAGPNLWSMLGEVQQASCRLVVKSKALMSPSALPGMIGIVSILALVTYVMRALVFDGVIWLGWVTVALIYLLFLIAVLIVAIMLARRPLIDMDESGLRLPSLKVMLPWDRVAEIHLTAPQLVSWIGAPIGFAVRPDGLAAKGLLGLAMRRQEGWIFLVDWQLDTAPEVVAAMALRLRSSSNSADGRILRAGGTGECSQLAGAGDHPTVVDRTDIDQGGARRCDDPRDAPAVPEVCLVCHDLAPVVDIDPISDERPAGVPVAPNHRAEWLARPACPDDVTTLVDARRMRRTRVQRGHLPAAPKEGLHHPVGPFVDSDDLAPLVDVRGHADTAWPAESAKVGHVSVAPEEGVGGAVGGQAVTDDLAAVVDAIRGTVVAAEGTQIDHPPIPPKEGVCVLFARVTLAPRSRRGH